MRARQGADIEGRNFFEAQAVIQAAGGLQLVQGAQEYARVARAQAPVHQGLGQQHSATRGRIVPGQVSGRTVDGLERQVRP